MQLPDFIKRMTGFADKVETHFTADQKLTAALARVTALESEISDLKSKSGDGEVKILHFTSDLQKAQDQVNTGGTEIKTLQEQLTAAKRLAGEVIASQGLSPDALPDASAPSPDAISELRKKLLASNDPQEKFLLAAQIRELLQPSAAAAE